MLFFVTVTVFLLACRSASAELLSSYGDAKACIPTGDCITLSNSLVVLSADFIHMYPNVNKKEDAANFPNFCKDVDTIVKCSDTFWKKCANADGTQAKAADIQRFERQKNTVKAVCGVGSGAAGRSQGELFALLPACALVMLGLPRVL